MLKPASSEFVALCRSQVALLTEGLGASLSVVYLTEELVEGHEAKLIPIVAYPETDVVWQEYGNVVLLPSDINAATLNQDEGAIAQALERPHRDGLGAAPVKFPRLLPPAPALHKDEQANLLTSVAFPEDSLKAKSPRENVRDRQRQKQKNPRQLVLPLIHEQVVMGLLVTSRQDRPWNTREQTQIERIANTLAIARILDRRQAWFEQQIETLHTTSLQRRSLVNEQQDILDNLLHQIRSPLTALRTFGKLLLKRLLPPDPNRDIANSIIRESERVQELLEQMDEALELGAEDLELITLAELVDEEGKSQMDTQRAPNMRMPLLPASSVESCSVAQVLEPLFVSATAIAGERQLTCFIDIPSDLPLVRANPKALREVLSNLIDNALKYTQAEGKIYIKVAVINPSETEDLEEKEAGQDWTKNTGQKTKNNEQIAIAISDTGPGIPPDDLSHLFERHYRGAMAATDIPGTGLGLAIARDILTQMQGEIEVKSPADPRWFPSDAPPTLTPGTTFLIWLPTDMKVEG